MGIFDRFRKRPPKGADPATVQPKLPDISAPDELSPKPPVADLRDSVPLSIGESDTRTEVPYEALATILKYEATCIIGVDLAGVDVVPVALEENTRGKFILAVRDDFVRFFALLYSKNDANWNDVNKKFKHNDMPYLITSIVKKNEPLQVGLILGGGFIEANHENKTLHVFGLSGSFGTAPVFMIRYALEGSAYSVTVTGTDIPSPEKQDAADWYATRGIPLQNRSVPYT